MSSFTFQPGYRSTPPRPLYAFKTVVDATSDQDHGASDGWRRTLSLNAVTSNSPGGILRRHDKPNNHAYTDPLRAPATSGLGLTMLLPNITGRPAVDEFQASQAVQKSTEDRALRNRGCNSPRVLSVSNTASPSLPTHFFRSSSIQSDYRATETRINRSSAMWLAMYFILNLTLTLHNKAVLVDLPYPYVLTAVHSLCSTLGALIMRRKGFYTPSRLGLRENVLLLAFSTLYSLNVAVSNVSLKMVSVPFHQVVRSTTPAFVLMLSYWFLHSTWGRSQLISLLLVITGVTIATFGDYSCTLAGFVLTLIGTFLAALKALMTGLIQSRQSDKPDIAPQSNRPCCVESLRLGLHPYDLLARMSPLALVQCLCYAHYSGELIHVAENASYGTVIILLANGIIAFALNVVSFTANKKTSALSMTVAANVKQVLTIMLAVFIFGLSISPLNIIGIAVTLLGGACYAWAQLCERTVKPNGTNSALHKGEQLRTVAGT